MSDMKRKIIMNLFFVGISLVFLVGGVRYGLGSLKEPHYGFLPFVISVLLLVLTLANIKEEISVAKNNRSSVAPPFFPEKESLKKLALCAVAMVAFTALLPYLGFSITTVLFMIFCLRFVEPQRWRLVLIVSAVTTISSYYIFKVFLEAQFPPGFLGI